MTEDTGARGASDPGVDTARRDEIAAKLQRVRDRIAAACRDVGRDPDEGRPQFLGAWRLCGDIGNSGGPLLVGAIAATAPLATACLVVGVLGLAGAGWVGLWTHRVDAARTALSRR